MVEVIVHVLHVCTVFLLVNIFQMNILHNENYFNRKSEKTMF